MQKQEKHVSWTGSCEYLSINKYMHYTYQHLGLFQ